MRKFKKTHTNETECVFVTADLAPGKNLVGIRAVGHCAEPDIQDGDILIVDRESAPELGQTMLCQDINSLRPCLMKYEGIFDSSAFYCHGIVYGINRKP